MPTHESSTPQNLRILGGKVELGDGVARARFQKYNGLNKMVRTYLVFSIHIHSQPPRRSVLHLLLFPTR